MEAYFHLHFVGHGSNGTALPTFYNAVGLTGKWMLGTRSLRVNLRLEQSTENQGQPIVRERDLSTRRSL